MTHFTTIVIAVVAASLGAVIYLRFRFGPYLGYKLQPVSKFRWQMVMFGFGILSSIALVFGHAPLAWPLLGFWLAFLVFAIVRFARTGQTL